MNALTLFRNLDRDLARPFWFNDVDDFYPEKQRNSPDFNSESHWDDTTKNWILTLEAIGVSKENLKIDVRENQLVIEAEKTKGISKGKFERIFSLPKMTDIEKIEATFEDGVLTVKLPQSEKRILKTIAIK
jgi:HSP20 family protein